MRVIQFAGDAEDDQQLRGVVAVVDHQRSVFRASR
jgi:hypothetical protein